MEKHFTYRAMMHLGLPIPPTWMLPPKTYEQLPDLQPTLRRYARLFDLGVVGKHVGYPMFMKPFDGGGWKAVSRSTTNGPARGLRAERQATSCTSRRRVDRFDRFVRCIGLGPQTIVVAQVRPRRAARRPLHDGPSLRHRRGAPLVEATTPPSPSTASVGTSTPASRSTRTGTHGTACGELRRERGGFRCGTGASADAGGLGYGRREWGFTVHVVLFMVREAFGRPPFSHSRNSRSSHEAGLGKANAGFAEEYSSTYRAPVCFAKLFLT